MTLSPITFYRSFLDRALDTIEHDSFVNFCKEIERASKFDYPILACGNGGSAAVAEHLSCDIMKGINTDTNLSPYVISLASNMSLMTALSNDFGYEEVFAKQIEWFDKQSIVLVISSSGNSPNIIRALKAAYDKNFSTIALVGFDGGVVLRDNLADIIVHVNSDNYGVVEDCHSIIMHAAAQKLRMEYANDLKKVRL